MRPCDMGDIRGKTLPEGRDAVEVQHTMMDVYAHDKSAGYEACLRPHHGDVAELEVAKTFAIGRNSFPVREVIWKKRGTFERARWHAGLFELLIRLMEIVHEYLLG